MRADNAANPRVMVPIKLTPRGFERLTKPRIRSAVGWTSTSLEEVEGSAGCAPVPPRPRRGQRSSETRRMNHRGETGFLLDGHVRGPRRTSSA